MRFIKRILLLFLLLIIIAGIGIYYFVPVDRIAKARLEEVFGPDFSIGKVGISLPHLEINNITYKDSKHVTQGVIKAESIKIYPSVLLLLTGRIVIKKIDIDAPYLLLRRFNDNKWTISRLIEGGGSKSKPVILKGIEIKNGVIEIRDDNAGKMPFKARIDDIKADIYNPISIIQHGTNIDISGRLNAKKQGRISIKGKWDELTGKLLLDAKIDNIDMTMLAPYIEGAGSVKIRSGILDIYSKIKFENSIVNAPVNAVIKDLEIESEEGFIMGVSIPIAVNLMKKDGVLDLRFNVYGPLNNIQTDLKEALKKKVEDSVREKVESPFKKMERGIKEIGKGIIDAFR